MTADFEIKWPTIPMPMPGMLCDECARWAFDQLCRHGAPVPLHPGCWKCELCGVVQSAELEQRPKAFRLKSKHLQARASVCSACCYCLSFLMGEHIASTLFGSACELTPDWLHQFFEGVAVAVAQGEGPESSNRIAAELAGPTESKRRPCPYCDGELIMGPTGTLRHSEPMCVGYEEKASEFMLKLDPDVMDACRNLRDYRARRERKGPLGDC